MSAFQLETIVPPSKRDRGTKLSRARLEALRTEAYASGFQDGVAKANQGLEAERNQLLANVSEQIADQKFDFDRARGELSRSIRDAFTAVLEAMASGLAKAHFEEQIVNRALEVMDRRMDGVVQIYVAADRVEAIRSMFEDEGLVIAIEADPSLGANAAVLRWGDGLDQIDLDGALDDIRAAIGSYVLTMEESDNEQRKHAG